MSFHYNKTSPFGRAHGDILSRVDSTTEEDKEKVVAELKSRGNAAFKSKRPEEAHLLYSAALHIDDQNWAIFGNRSAVNEMMGKGEEALEDANSATKIKPDWAKGFFRKGKAYACLKRYRECVEAYEQALSLEPDSKMLQKSVKKAKIAEEKADADAAAKAIKTEKKKIDMAPPTMTKVALLSSSKDKSTVLKEEGSVDYSLKGYKKTSDGRTTSFFNMEIDDTAKELIGSIAPKKIFNAPVEDPELVSKGASAWNKGGTYEERNCTEWAEQYLRAAIGEFQHAPSKDGWSVSFTKVKSLEGDCSVVLRQGKKRYVFDFEVTVNFDVINDNGDILSSGEWVCNDFNSEAEGECDVSLKIQSGKDLIRSWLKKKGVEELVNNLWAKFVAEYRSAH
jgi:tetratricopeptide (TPR) repeat protein